MAGSLRVSSGVGGSISTRTPGARRQLYKGTRAGGAWGAGIPLVPAGAHPHTGLRAHLPRMNIPARHSLARIGLPHPSDITAPSHLLLEAQPEVPPPSCHSSPTHCAARLSTSKGWDRERAQGSGRDTAAGFKDKKPGRGSWCPGLSHEALEGRAERPESNDPSASLTRDPELTNRAAATRSLDTDPQPPARSLSMLWGRGCPRS